LFSYEGDLLRSGAYCLHRDTALAILSEKDGLEALKRDQYPTPLQLLIKEMPGEASHVNLPSVAYTCNSHFWNNLWHRYEYIWI